MFPQISFLGEEFPVGYSNTPGDWFETNCIGKHFAVWFDEQEDMDGGKVPAGYWACKVDFQCDGNEEYDYEACMYPHLPLPAVKQSLFAVMRFKGEATEDDDWDVVGAANAYPKAAAASGEGEVPVADRP